MFFSVTTFDDFNKFEVILSILSDRSESLFRKVLKLQAQNVFYSFMVFDFGFGPLFPFC